MFITILYMLNFNQFYYIMLYNIITVNIMNGRACYLIQNNIGRNKRLSTMLHMTCLFSLSMSWLSGQDSVLVHQVLLYSVTLHHYSLFMSVLYAGPMKCKCKFTRRNIVLPGLLYMC